MTGFKGRVNQQLPNFNQSMGVMGGNANNINVNQGGPYGSDILKSIQLDSERVWLNVINDEDKVYTLWNKACIAIETTANDDWVVRAASFSSGVKSNKVFQFIKSL